MTGEQRWPTTRADPLLDTKMWRWIRERKRAEWSLSNAPCARCGLLINYGAKSPDPASLVCGHRISRAELRRAGRLDLVFDVSNLQPEHRRCSMRAGGAEGRTSPVRIQRAQRRTQEMIKEDPPRWVMSSRW